MENDFRQDTKTKQTSPIRRISIDRVSEINMDELTALNPVNDTKNRIDSLDTDSNDNIQNVQTQRKLDHDHDNKNESSNTVDATDAIDKIDYSTIDLNRPWNTLLSLQLKKIGEKSIAYKWLNDYESNYYESYEARCERTGMILQIILGTLTSAFFVSFVSGLSNGSAVVIALTVIQLVIMGLWGIVDGIRSSGDFIRRANDHKYISTKFNELYLQIQGQFILPVQKRVNDIDFFSSISKNFNDYMFTAPSIRESTEKLYLSACKNESIYKPIIIGGFEKVEIVINDNKSTDIRVASHDDDLNDNNTRGTYRRKKQDRAQSFIKSTRDRGFDEEVSFEINRWLRNF
jgi:hypothetical protein